MEAKNRLKVAFLIDHYGGPGAGTERQMFLLANALPDVGVDVRLAVFRHSSFTQDGEFPAPVEHLSAARVLSPLSWWRVYRWAKRARAEGVSVVHIFFNDPALFAPALLALAGLRCVVARRDMGFWYTPAKLFLLRRMQPFVDAMCANSHAVVQHCGDAEGYPDHKRLVIPNAMLPAVDTPQVATRDDRFTVGIVANIRPIKRIEDAVRAVAGLRDSGKDVVLRVVGGGDSHVLQRLANELGVSSQVQFAGASKQVAAELAAFDMALLCSESEGLSNAIMEYMQAGLPVVATATGGNAELVTEHVTGFLYPVGDVPALAAHMGRLFDDRALAESLGAAGSRRVRDDFSMERVATAYAALYRGVSATGVALGQEGNDVGSASQ